METLTALPECQYRCSRNHRCGACKACIGTRAILWGLFDEGRPPSEVAKIVGIPRTQAQAYSNRWAEDRGREDGPRWKRRGNSAYAAISVKPKRRRPTCTCGLSIDKDHGPANCDFGLTTTGLGSWAGVNW